MRAAAAGARGAAEIVERRGRVGDPDVGAIDLLADDRPGGAGREGLVEEKVAVGRLALHRDEQIAAARPRANRRPRRSPRSRRATAPPVAAAISSRSTARSCRALPRDGDVVEGEHPVADDLALLVALAGEQDDVVRARLGHRRGDRLAAAGHLARARARPAGCRGGSPPDPRSCGLSSVTMTRSASRAATAPISGRLPTSRSPPAPKTMISRPLACGRSASIAASIASGVWA